MGGIFISYRRQDSAGHARALYDRVRPRFPGQVFMDVAGSIPPGVDFVEAIERAVGTCRILIVIIGREWTTGTDQKGRRRLDDPNDFIRLEVATALRRNVVVIPVLVEGAQMPTAADLPDDLALLGRRQAVELRDTRWDADVDELVVALGRTLAKDTAAGAPRGAAAATGGERADVARSSRPEPIPPADSRGPSERPRSVPQRPAREHQQQRARSKGTWVAALGVLVFGAACVGAYFWLVNARVTVPRLVGQPFDSARERIESAGLVLGETAARRTTYAPPSHVLEQSPAAGTRVQKGSSVNLVLSERQARVVPNVVAKDLEAAREDLSKAGISVRSVRTEEAQHASANSVLRVEPAAGTEIAGESPSVELVVAVASDRRLAVPDLTGISLGDATEQLKRAGLVARIRAGQNNSSLPELQVIGQEPAAGVKLERGAIVTLVFNPRAVRTMPNVVGRSVSDAQKMLARDGFPEPRVANEETARFAAGTVVGQTPAAGTEIGIEGTPIELRVTTRVASRTRALDLGRTKIAFVSGDPPYFTNHLSLINWDGTGATVILRSHAAYSFPTWSPDGRIIAFAAFFDVESSSNGIYTMKPDGTDMRHVIKAQGVESPAWSPDGTRIAYVSPQSGDQDIWVKNIYSGRSTRLTNDPRREITPSWSPDGTMIAFASDRDASDRSAWYLEIYVMNADGTGARALTKMKGAKLHPRWSPDGRRIAFYVSQIKGEGSIYVMNSDGTNVARLTNPEKDDWALSWSPDGTRIVYSSRYAVPRLFMMNADGTDQRLLTDVPGGAPSWSPPLK